MQKHPLWKRLISEPCLVITLSMTLTIICSTTHAACPNEKHCNTEPCPELLVHTPIEFELNKNSHILFESCSSATLAGDPAGVAMSLAVHCGITTKPVANELDRDIDRINFFQRSWIEVGNSCYCFWSPSTQADTVQDRVASRWYTDIDITRPNVYVLTATAFNPGQLKKYPYQMGGTTVNGERFCNNSAPDPEVSREVRIEVRPFTYTPAVCTPERYTTPPLFRAASTLIVVSEQYQVNVGEESHPVWVTETQVTTGTAYLIQSIKTEWKLLGTKAALCGQGINVHMRVRHSQGIFDNLWGASALTSALWSNAYTRTITWAITMFNNYSASQPVEDLFQFDVVCGGAQDRRVRANVWYPVTTIEESVNVIGVQGNTGGYFNPNYQNMVHRTKVIYGERLIECCPFVNDEDEGNSQP